MLSRMFKPKIFTFLYARTFVPIKIFQIYEVHTYALSKSLQLISNDKISKVKDLKISDAGFTDKPLTLMYSWMLGKDRQILKYSKFYTDRDINVLRVKITPFELLRPTKGSQVVADQVLKFLLDNESVSPLIVHGFSVGAYTFCESMVKAANDMTTYRPVLNRFVGQIWDSAVDVYGIPSGFSKALTKNKMLQASLEKYFAWYLKYNYEMATRHYEKSSQMMFANTLGVPGLIMFSKSDVVSYPEMNMRVVNQWEKDGFSIFTKCFEKSTHVAHYLKYREEYLEEISVFLERIGFLQVAKERSSAALSSTA